MENATLESRHRARSLWLDQVAEPLTPRAGLPSDLDCDAAIVGAGFTGLWCAYYLKRLQPDLRVVVLEAEVAGFGPSGRNGGWASGGIGGSPRVYERNSDRDAVVRATRATFHAVDEIGEVAEREGIDCGYVKAGLLTVATSAPQEERLRGWTDGSRAAGMSDQRCHSASQRGVTAPAVPATIASGWAANTASTPTSGAGSVSDAKTFCAAQSVSACVIR